MSRIVFVGYMGWALVGLRQGWLPETERTAVWFFYVLGLYLTAEWLYRLFLRRGVDMAFAFPIGLAILGLNVVTIYTGGQDGFPLLNRAEHLVTFVLVAFVVWVFFMQWLPTGMWQEHPYYTAWTVLGIVTLAGLANEFMELVLDQFFGTRLVGADGDTVQDLLMNTLGAVLFLATRLILGEAGWTGEGRRR